MILGTSDTWSTNHLPQQTSVLCCRFGSFFFISILVYILIAILEIFSIFFFSKSTLFFLGMDIFYYPDSMSSDKDLRVARLRDFLFVLGAVVCVCIVMYCLVLGLIIVLLPSISFTEEKYVRHRRLFWLMRINPQNSLFDRHVKYGVEKGLQVRSNSTHTTTIEVTQDY